MLKLRHSPSPAATLSGHHIDSVSGLALHSQRSFALRFPMARNSNTTTSSSTSPMLLKHHTPPTLPSRASLESPHTSPRNDDLPVHGMSETIVGVLEGEQLGWMICQAASQMAIKVSVLDPMVNYPASALSHNHMVGSYDDSATVEEFAKRCGVLTVEIEHVDVATLEKLEQQG